MLYLNSLENRAASETKNQYAICYESVPGMTNIVELTPSKELLRQWESKIIDWEEFRKGFTAELREEYSKGDKSRLKGLTKYSLENNVTLHSPEPSGEQTYRAILAEVINLIWQGLEPRFRPNKRDSRVTEIPLELNESKGFIGVKRSLYPFETFQTRITPTKVFSTSLFPTDFG